jgi:hypothetical protein
MRMRVSWLVILAITILGGSVTATEFRSPLIGDRGPMRYVFEEWEEEDYGLKVWSAVYSRESHKAFLNHGTETHPLSALFFGQPCFTISQALPDSYAPLNTEGYSPYLGTTKLYPDITYDERGLSLGASFSYPIYKNKGRLGIRGRVAFKRIEIEREDSGDKSDDPASEFVTGEVVTRNSSTAAQATDVFARAVRMDFLESIPYTAPDNAILEFTPVGAPKIVGNDANWDATGMLPPGHVGAVIQSPVGILPHSPDRLLGIHQENPTPVPSNLPASGGVNDGNQYIFNQGTNYTPLNIHAGSISDRLAASQRASELWITSVHAPANGSTGFSDKSQILWDTLDLALKNYQNNVYAWLIDRGFEFESETRSGISDIDLDLFYEHQFADDLNGEAFVRLPTGGSSNYCCNPYRPHLGNGNHWEFRLGGLVAWQPLSWMNAKLDAYYAFALGSKEDRPAAFKGACIKNIGPCTTADVSWSYFVGNLDFNFFHPKTDAISGLLGYEFYYKMKDKIDFGCKTMESWLGQSYNVTTGLWEENLQTLDNAVAERRTQAIAHRIRFENSFRITRWFELYWGFAYTFAGENIPRELDGTAGCVVTF